MAAQTTQMGVLGNETAHMFSGIEFIDDRFGPALPPIGVHIDYPNNRILMTHEFFREQKDIDKLSRLGAHAHTVEFNFKEQKSFIYFTPNTRLKFISYLDQEYLDPEYFDQEFVEIPNIRSDCQELKPSHERDGDLCKAVQRLAYRALFRTHPKLEALANLDLGYPALFPGKCVEELQKLSLQLPPKENSEEPSSAASSASVEP